MELRGATHRDIGAIQGLIRAGVQEGTLKHRTRTDIKKNIGGFTLAEEGGQVVGMASVVVYDRRLAEVRSVFVQPPFRGNGLGKELVRSIQEKSAQDLPSATIFAITTMPGLFESDGFDSKQGERHILFKNI